MKCKIIIDFVIVGSIAIWLMRDRIRYKYTCAKIVWIIKKEAIKRISIKVFICVVALFLLVFILWVLAVADSAITVF